MALLRTFLALVALVGALAHGPAIAEPPLLPAASHMMAQTMGSGDCHTTASATEAAKPEPGDCCPDGCDGDCAMAGAFFALFPVGDAVGFLRADLVVPGKAALVASRTVALERPPKRLI